MNKLEQITNELLEAGYTIEGIIAAFNEIIKASNQTKADDKTNKLPSYLLLLRGKGSFDLHLGVPNANKRTLYYVIF